MPEWVSMEHGTLHLFGVTLLAFNAGTLHKLALTAAFIAFLLVVRLVLKSGIRLTEAWLRAQRTAFWSRQATRLLLAILTLVGLASIWFDNPARLATVLGLVTAGIAFALQKVVTAIAGYFLILRGKTFNVGDRIVMGGVRGEVIALGFFQTTIMEMGEPPSAQPDPPAMWITARQFTGRIVTVSNARVFDDPVYNYTRDLPFLWEEIRLPVSYKDDRVVAERILLEAARKHSLPIASLSKEALAEMKRRYLFSEPELEPRVYYRLTDNWLELAVRFMVHDRGIREVKDAMSRDILTALTAANIGIASSTSEIVGLPPLRVQGPVRVELQSRSG